MKATFTRFALLIFVCSIWLTACKSAPKGDGAGEAEASTSSDLNWADAKLRAERLSQIHYNLAIELDDKKDHFNGRSVIVFDLKHIRAPLRVDFSEDGTVEKITINGQDFPASLKRQYWITLPAHALKVGTNQVEVQYTHKYSRRGRGLHRFQDPMTKDVFLYTQFEVADAQRFMPCFDQPDLRATLNLRVLAPRRWQVISTTSEVSKKPLSGRPLVEWTFAKTQPIATYLFSLHAGPYRVWKDQFENIPLRLFARPSLAGYVRSNEWFRVTKQGLNFFNSYFGYPYPFGKYDQLLVPEFNSGAMENVGAVTFSERYIPRSVATRRQKRGRAETILHEMAHMWFGDLVTMKWWNDLWLNESFASYMATLAVYEATEFKEIWQDFFVSDKRWAYWSDGLSTTHPIEAEISSVKSAMANFDGITYGKGAATLKQLQAYVGARGFQQGMRTYVKEHAYKNTELKDFIAALQLYSEKDLSHWSERWLRQSGTDRLSAKWECTGDRLKRVQLIVTPSKDARFRPQTVTVGLYGPVQAKMQSIANLVANLEGTTTNIDGDWPCPGMVYPNAKDEGYARVSLDLKTLNWAKANLADLDDLLVRTMLWSDIWQMVRETEMSLSDYVAVTQKQMPLEADATILEMVVDNLDMVFEYWPLHAQAEKNRFAEDLERQFLNRIRSARTGSDTQKFWLDSLIDLASTRVGLDALAAWAASGRVNKSLSVDLDRHWKIVRRLARYQHPQLNTQLANVKKLDRSDRGVRESMAVEAIQPVLSIKRKWVDILKQPQPTISLAEARSVLGSLFPFEQFQLAQGFRDEFFQYLDENKNSDNVELIVSVAAGLSPLHCDEDSFKKVRSYVEEKTPMAPSLLKNIKMQLDEDERCQKIRAMSAL